MDQNKVDIRNRQLSVCQGDCTCIHIGFGQGPFPKSGLDKISVFPMTRLLLKLGSFYCILNLFSAIAGCGYSKEVLNGSCSYIH